jgi:hypothetical protein
MERVSRYLPRPKALATLRPFYEAVNYTALTKNCYQKKSSVAKSSVRYEILSLHHRINLYILWPKNYLQHNLSLDPSPDGSMVHSQTALTHHLFQITIGELKPTMPANAQKDDCRLEMPSLERRFGLFQGYDSRRVMIELMGDYSQRSNSCNRAAVAVIPTPPFWLAMAFVFMLPPHAWA